MRLKTVFFQILGTLLVSLATSGFGDDHSQGRLLVVINGTLNQDAYLVPDFVYFMPENSLALFEDTVVAANAYPIGWVPTDEGSFSCYLLNRDTDISSTEQGTLLCISPEWPVDRADSGVDDLVTNSYKVTQAEEQWFDTPSPIWSIDDGKGSFVQQLGSLLSSLWEWLLFSDNVSEEAEKNSTSFALPEWPVSAPEPILPLSGGGFPFDPAPFPFMPDISAKGLFDMPDWQFDYLLALSRIKQRLKQWLYNGYPVTSSKPRQLVSAHDLSAALKGVTQNLKEIIQKKKVLNKSLSKMPLDASKLLAQLSGKGLPDYPQVHQPETVMLYPVFRLPQSASNILEDALGVEYVGKGCNICRTIFKKADFVVQTSCLHLFHMHCLKQLLAAEASGERVNVCPNCRQEQRASGGFLNSEKVTTNQERLANPERAALQEVTQIATLVQARARTWPENDRGVFARLNSAESSSDPTIAEPARALRPLVSFYSVQHLVSQVRAEALIWPKDDREVFARLNSAESSSNPTIAEQARVLRPLVDLYSVQHLVSKVQAKPLIWPDNDREVFDRLNFAESSSDPTIAVPARALRPLVGLYSVQHLVSKVQARARTWPEDDREVFDRLNFAESSSDPTIAVPARALRPLVGLYSVQHLVSKVQARALIWPDNDREVFDHLNSAEECRSDPTIAEQAQAQTLRPIVDFYSVQHLVSQMQAGARTWPENDRGVYASLSSAEECRSDPTIAEQAQALRPIVDFYSVQHLVSQMQAEARTWPKNDRVVYASLNSAESSSDPTIAEQAQALRPIVDFYSVQHLVSQMQAGARTWPENDREVYASLNSAESSSDPIIAEQARALRPLVYKYANKWSKK